MFLNCNPNPTDFAQDTSYNFILKLPYFAVKMTDFVDYAMRRKIDACLKSVALILDTSKASKIASAEQVPHAYVDKYLLANHLISSSIVCYLNGLELLGLSRAVLATLKGWSARRAVTLQFEKQRRCKFVKEVERDVEEPSRVQVDSSLFGRSTVKVITKVKEYIYHYEESYILRAFSGVGTDANESITLHESHSQMELTTHSAEAPFDQSSCEKSEVNISWLLNHLDVVTLAASFDIDRTAAKCHTPRQNEDVEDALKFSSALSTFCFACTRLLRASYKVYNEYR